MTLRPLGLIDDLATQSAHIEFPCSVTRGLEELIREEEAARMGENRDALDQLFFDAQRYRNGNEHQKMMEFLRRFRFYSPYNSMLIHIQRPGAVYVATPSRWMEEFGRRVTSDALPIVILRPRGPVMFVFDISDTECEKADSSTPTEVEHPFEVRGGRIGQELELTIENAKRDGILIRETQYGSQKAGQIASVESNSTLRVVRRRREPIKYGSVKKRFELALNAKLSREAKFATIAHELGHLYCGHLGTPDKKWWPERTRLSREQREFEAESVCYIVCGRLGIDNPSDEYLGGYWKSDFQVPSISLEAITKAAGLIERMCKGYLPLR